MKQTEHILGTSATMVGVSVTLITLMQVFNTHEATIIDEALAVNMVLFTTACILSYLSMRDKRNERYERLADKVFLASLITLFVIGLLLTFTTI